MELLLSGTSKAGMQFSKVQYRAIRVAKVRGRYITNAALETYFSRYQKKINTRILGRSVQKKPIYEVQLGEGPLKILMWSQMHGNESTTTKAILDLINLFMTGNKITERIVSKCTLKIVPILNPDGAAAYTRMNGNGIDLNRDARNLSQPESRVLRDLFDNFQPHFCFNLHDQRTIYNVGTSTLPATISFLAPASDRDRSVTPSREASMKLIVAVTEMLRAKIPGQIGRYDDAFNPNCVGDAFQLRATPTVLFEAGHYPKDYERERTREYLFYSLLQAIWCIAFNRIDEQNVADYFSIPENNKMLYDILITNAREINPKYPKGSSLGILFKEILKDDTIVFEPQIEEIGELASRFGHVVYSGLNPSDIEKIKGNNLLSELLL